MLDLSATVTPARFVPGSIVFSSDHMHVPMQGDHTYHFPPSGEPVRLDIPKRDLTLEEALSYRPPAPPYTRAAPPYPEERPCVRFFRLDHGKALPATEYLPAVAAIPLPSYETAGAAAMDLRAAILRPFTLYAGCAAAIPTGFAIAIQDGWEGQARGRSGLAAKFRVTVTHGVGTIDSDFRGEVVALLTNHGEEPLTIQRGDRIMQLVIAKAPQAWVYETDIDFRDETSRGVNGFGSTGVQ